MSDFEELKAHLNDLKAEMQANTKLTTDGFSTMNGRVKTLEISEARREGRESVMNTSIDFKKLSIVVPVIIALAGAIAWVMSRTIIK